MSDPGCLPRCEICGTTELVRRPLLMRPDDPPVICAGCEAVWYEYGAVTAAEIRRIRETPDGAALVAAMMQGAPG